jgi:hypothetical protein
MCLDSSASAKSLRAVLSWNRENHRLEFDLLRRVGSGIFNSADQGTGRKKAAK